jgi:hypothetical protein
MIDITKTYQTRCGYPVRFYATDGYDDYQIHGACCINGKWHSFAWSVKGEAHLGNSSKYDLIEVKPRIQREVWVNVYEDYVGACHTTKQEAEESKDPDPRLACVKIPIDCEHGEGLE